MRFARLALAVVAIVAAVLLAGCAASESPPARAPSASVHALPAPIHAVATEAAAPVELTARGGRAHVDPVATDAGGALIPPTGVARLGWWVDSALPGSGRGTVVITGHIDDSTQGTGFAARFAGMRPGERVTVTTAGGGPVDYRITRVDETDKASGEGSGGLPVAELNRQDGVETLALVTCGGPFIGPPLGYRDNIIAWATRA